MGDASRWEGTQEILAVGGTQPQPTPLPRATRDRRSQDDGAICDRHLFPQQ